MAQLIVRNLEETIKERLKVRALSHGRSMEEEVRDILRIAVRNTEEQPPKLGSRLRQRFSEVGLDDDIQELRGTVAEPAPFDQ